MREILGPIKSRSLSTRCWQSYSYGIPRYSARCVCANHALDFNELLDHTTFVVTLRDPCDWIESFWGYIIQKELTYPHLLLPESQQGFLKGVLNPLHFDKAKMEVNGISLDNYISRFKDMRESTFWEIVKHVRSGSVRYRTINNFMKFHASPAYLPLQSQLFDLSPFQGYSALNYAIKACLYGNFGADDMNIYNRINLFVIPTESLNVFLNASKNPLFFDLFRNSGIEALHSKARKDKVPESRKNVNQA